MTKKWNLQDIHPSERRPKTRESNDIAQKRTAAPAGKQPSRGPAGQVSASSYNRQRRVPRKRDLLIKIGIGIVAVAAVAFLATFFFKGAEVVVYPKHQAVTVQAAFSAYTEPSAGALGYELLTLEAEGERQVNATGREEVSERAEGQITIYNEFSENPIRLVKNTRFESPDGLVFKITESAVVPGYTEDSSGVTPGSVVADVFADGTGEAYNLPPSEFTVPGFAGEPEFDGVYARSTIAFGGGFEGERYIVEESELEAAQESLHAELREALRSRLDAERPAGFVLYDEAVTFAFESEPTTDEGGGDLATITERGKLQVPIFNNADFAGYIAENTVAGYEGMPVQLSNPENLSFSYASSSAAVDLSSQNQIEFTLNGSSELVWTFDEAQLKEDLAGLSKSGLPTVLSGYTAIDKAEATIRPFWKRSFPESADKISVEIVVE